MLTKLQARESGGGFSGCSIDDSFILIMWGGVIRVREPRSRWQPAACTAVRPDGMNTKTTMRRLA
jgi:hypothetical protein